MAFMDFITFLAFEFLLLVARIRFAIELPFHPKLYTSCLDSCDMVSHGVYSFGFFGFFGLFCFFFVFSCFLFSLWSPLQRVAKYCFFGAVFFVFSMCFFWISLNLLTCILKKRAFYLDFEAMWCKTYCKLQCFLYFILGKQHPCEHPIWICIYIFIYI